MTVQTNSSNQTGNQTINDYLGYLDRLADKVLQSCGLVDSALPKASSPFDIAADSMFTAVERGASKEVRRLTVLLDLALVIRRARMVDNPKVVGELVMLADELAARLLTSGHPASASSSTLAPVPY